MNGCSHYRLISESSTVTNDSLEAINSDTSKDSRVKTQNFGWHVKTRSVYEPKEDNKTSVNTDYDLPSDPSPAPFRELKEIFEKPRAEIEEKKRLKFERDFYANDLHYRGKSKTDEVMMASALSNEKTIYPNGTDTGKQSVTISDMSEALLYSNDHKTVSRKEDVCNYIDKSNSSTCQCCHLQNQHLNKKHKFDGQKLSGVLESSDTSSINIPVENMRQSSSAKTANPFENKLNIEGTGTVNPESRNVQYGRCDTQEETVVGKITDIKVRDEIINDYQLQEMMCHKAIKLKLDEDYAEIQKLRRNYSSLRKLFLALAILNIILILCVVSVMPVLLVTFKLSNEEKVLSEEDATRLSAKHLSSAEAEHIIKEHVFCVKCDRLKDSWSDIFTKEHFKGCCIKDVATFIGKILDFIEKERDSLLEKIAYDNQKQNNEILTLQNVVFNTSFNGSKHGASLIGQCERNFQLINTLLTRKRLAIHLSGTGSSKRLVWVQDLSQGHSNGRHSSHHHGNMIKVENGGVHFVYSCIHFDAGSCNFKSYIGYHILMRHGAKERIVASIYHSCVNGTNTEMVLTLHQMVNIPGGRDTILYINIDSDHLSISEQRRHYFGLFEI